MKFLSLLILLLIFPIKIFAAAPPTLLSPANNSQVSSTGVQWNTPSYNLYSSNPYRIQIDDNSDFASTEKDTYSSDNKYQPQSLDFKTWYWRVKAKDSNGTWSDWSEIWQFTLTAASPTPSPSSTSTTTPTPSPSSSTKNTITTSNTPTNINSNQSFQVKVNLTDTPNSDFYIKGAFVKSGSSNYFGKTKVSGNWIKNAQSSLSQFKLTTNSSGVGQTDLEVMPDPDDSGFLGSGDYIFKVARYNKDGENLTWSNEVTLKINSVSAPFVIATPTPSPSQITNFPKSASPSSNLIEDYSSSDQYNDASVAGIAFMSTPQPSLAINEASIENSYLPKIIKILLGIMVLSIGLFLILRSKYPDIFSLERFLRK